MFFHYILCTLSCWLLLDLPIALHWLGAFLCCGGTQLALLQTLPALGSFVLVLHRATTRGGSQCILRRLAFD